MGFFSELFKAGIAFIISIIAACITLDMLMKGDKENTVFSGVIALFSFLFMMSSLRRAWHQFKYH